MTKFVKFDNDRYIFNVSSILYAYYDEESKQMNIVLDNKQAAIVAIPCDFADYYRFINSIYEGD